MLPNYYRISNKNGLNISYLYVRKWKNKLMWNY